ncbi:tRNA (adenosine(37)-N6)-threonylcarbamoyltransferase complex ATPase subunit type 1 TsaE [Pelagibacterium montanilacus]|uniref:tRNA (adenosine(37)-N6)-threonylcarbamoyltransferase complex ATPase subunit type 1 TsaE n=1 Tax=Pelagibacterium montanilacus TaxID=2185280 RepID=UPI000F8E85BF|nr:tRNA (adenosine(37)-N6)-threonylcarbamoyltransferase complex ATPase subunit type 1 TsaE [Pelagibacterium montanilacus]
MGTGEPDLVVIAAREADTGAIALALAPLLTAGETIALVGGLGAGKSALARALIRARLGDPDHEVPSPTFSLVQPHGAIVHADLYRLADPDEIGELGLFEDEEAIVIVEWPERAPEVLTREGLTISIAILSPGEARQISIRARGAREMGAIAEALAPFCAPAAR